MSSPHAKHVDFAIRKTVLMDDLPSALLDGPHNGTIGVINDGALRCVVVGATDFHEMMQRRPVTLPPAPKPGPHISDVQAASMVDAYMSTMPTGTPRPALHEMFPDRWEDPAPLADILAELPG
ncbi:hypothetical protein [Tritonibacter mobilis]|uniref:hypothetical protein n=1 Tax=Tritonibacter mobilis TaxID=379347 RepID=UPI000806EBEB|nr:hypothetical protein [Tritonibacter mobilis]